ncbi:Aminopeptidase [Caenorhabditis elegans]|uniref:Aminopeptidase n=1 Tax=Caenorhabditis elegans TaxID=6239 RepID=Q9U2H2_CAEEL|nr:Aminopeptidase [Caenorhabditis elegans]CAB63366.1 Aminopeptidase [Caenorhabditis elegans]|eukprot:NP_505820.1 Aminopeptidase [Caenorhabditis elegans]
MATPDSACPLLYEFVISPFALEECRQGTSSEPGRMRPFSDAVTASASTTSTTAVATTVTSEQRQQSCCSARPLAIGVVAVSMSFALIYFFMIVPLTSSILPSQSSPILPSDISTIYQKSSTDFPIFTNSTELITTTEDPLYVHINNTNHRLQIPQIHIPLLYEVELKLFVPWRPTISFGSDNFSVKGHVRVHFTSGGGSRILLHSDSKQHIGDCVVRDELNRNITVKLVGRQYSQILDLNLETDMIHGMNYTLDVAFKSAINLNLAYGLFAAPYTFENETRYVVATQLQISEARTVFPCIDVPDMKAQFDTVIIHPTGTTSIANMMENSTKVDGEWTTTTFHRTPPMSTYLFAFSVSDYPYLETFSGRGVRSRVYCDPTKLVDAQLITKSIGPVLDFYEDYFGIPYPLEKLDVVIVPALSVTAMENWGLITIRQTNGLYTEGRFAISQKHDVQEIVAHELAHQWFGNLVTMKWWNDLWLNEGFATLISVRAVDFLENTTWRYEDSSAESQCVALRADQIDSISPVSGKKNSNFDSYMEIQGKAIIYKKSAIIIRMIERLVEEDIFRQGLKRFLNTFLYKNADHEDLFNVLVYVHDSSAGGHLRGQNFSLSDVMDTWIRQAHFPVIHVNRKEGSLVTLRQEKYEHVPRDEPEKQVWKIPIFYDDPVSGKHKVFWLTDTQPKVFDMGGLLVVDPHQLTYMRLRYDMEMYSDITMALMDDFTMIPTNSRSRLIDDTLAMAENGQLTYKVPFNLTMYMSREIAYRPFQTFSAYLDFFLPRMYIHEGWSIYKKYLELVVGIPFDKFNAEGLDVSFDHNTDLFHTRQIVVFRACGIEYEPCVRMAKQRFAELRVNCSGENQLLSGMECNKIPYYLRPHVYSAAINDGTQEDFDFLYKKWMIEHYMMEHDNIFTGLCTTNIRENSDRAWRQVIKNGARENVMVRAQLCSKKLSKNNFILDLLYEDKVYLKEFVDKDRKSLFALQQLLYRKINYEEEVLKADEVFKPYPQLRWIPKLRAIASDRLDWRKTVAAQFTGNASEAIEEMRKFQITI